MDWTDLTQIEAYARNLLIWIGKQYDLPLAGRDWEIVALAVVALIALMIWIWPTRRAFRVGGPLRWVVAGLNLASLAFWPLWFLALILSGVRRSSPAPAARPAQPHAAAVSAGAVPALLLNALKQWAQTAAQKSTSGKRVGPWGKPTSNAPPATIPSTTRPASQRPQPAISAARRGSVLPNRETWIRRR
jgi:hypothetical protein